MTKGTEGPPLDDVARDADAPIDQQEYVEEYRRLNDPAELPPAGVVALIRGRVSANEVGVREYVKALKNEGDYASVAFSDADREELARAFLDAAGRRAMLQIAYRYGPYDSFPQALIDEAGERWLSSAGPDDVAKLEKIAAREGVYVEVTPEFARAAQATLDRLRSTDEPASGTEAAAPAPSEAEDHGTNDVDVEPAPESIEVEDNAAREPEQPAALDAAEPETVPLRDGAGESRTNEALPQSDEPQIDELPTRVLAGEPPTEVAPHELTPDPIRDEPDESSARPLKGRSLSKKERETLETGMSRSLKEWLAAREPHDASAGEPATEQSAQERLVVAPEHVVRPPHPSKERKGAAQFGRGKAPQREKLQAEADNTIRKAQRASAHGPQDEHAPGAGLVHTEDNNGVAHKENVREHAVTETEDLMNKGTGAQDMRRGEEPTAEAPQERSSESHEELLARFQAVREEYKAHKQTIAEKRASYFAAAEGYEQARNETGWMRSLFGNTELNKYARRVEDAQREYETAMDGIRELRIERSAAFMDLRVQKDVSGTQGERTKEKRQEEALQQYLQIHHGILMHAAQTNTEELYRMKTAKSEKDLFHNAAVEYLRAAHSWYSKKSLSEKVAFNAKVGFAAGATLALFGGAAVAGAAIAGGAVGARRAARTLAGATVGVALGRGAKKSIDRIADLKEQVQLEEVKQELESASFSDVQRRVGAAAKRRRITKAVGTGAGIAVGGGITGLIAGAPDGVPESTDPSAALDATDVNVPEAAPETVAIEAEGEAATAVEVSEGSADEHKLEDLYAQLFPEAPDEVDVTAVSAPEVPVVHDDLPPEAPAQESVEHPAEPTPAAEHIELHKAASAQDTFPETPPIQGAIEVRGTKIMYETAQDDAGVKYTCFVRRDGTEIWYKTAPSNSDHPSAGPTDSDVVLSEDVPAAVREDFVRTLAQKHDALEREIELNEALARDQAAPPAPESVASPEKLSLTGSYEGGSSVERELQQFLQTDEWVTGRYGDLSDSERGAIAHQLRLELMNDADAASALKIRGGDWNNVWRGDTYTYEIDRALVEKHIDAVRGDAPPVQSPAEEAVSDGVTEHERGENRVLDAYDAETKTRTSVRLGEFPDRVRTNLEELHEEFPDYRGEKTMESFKEVWSVLKESGQLSPHIESHFAQYQGTWGPLSHVRVRDLFDAREGVTFTIGESTGELAPEAEMELRHIIEKTRYLAKNDDVFIVAQQENFTVGQYMESLRMQLSVEAEAEASQPPETPEAATPEAERGAEGIRPHHIHEVVLPQPGEVSIETGQSVDALLAGRDLSAHETAMHAFAHDEVYREAVRGCLHGIADAKQLAEGSDEHVRIDWDAYKRLAPRDALEQLEEQRRLLTAPTRSKGLLARIFT